MSLEDFDVVPEAKSPFSKSATEAPRSARSRATPAPAIPPPITTASSAAPSSPVSLVMSSASRSALHQLLDRSYHVIGGVLGDSRVIRARDAAQHENGVQARAPAHRDIRLDGVADHHRSRR